MTKIIRFIKIQDQIIDLLFVDDIINETYKGGDLIIRNNFGVSHRFNLDEDKGEELCNIVYSLFEEFRNEENYTTIKL